MLWWNFAKFLISFLKAQVSFPSNLHQYSVPSNITHLCFFSLNILYFSQKQLIKVQISEIFKSSGKNVPNSPCHFPNHKTIFLQILHDSLMSWKVTPLYFFRSNVIYFVWKSKFWRLLSAQIKIYQILVIFETKNRFFFKFCINLQYQET